LRAWQQTIMDFAADLPSKRPPFERIVVFLAKWLIRLTVILAIWQATSAGGRKRFRAVAFLGLSALSVLADALGALIQVRQGALALPGISGESRPLLPTPRRDKGDSAVTRILRPRNDATRQVAPKNFWEKCRCNRIDEPGALTASEVWKKG